MPVKRTRESLADSTPVDPRTWSRDQLWLYSSPTLDAFIDRAFGILHRVVPCDCVSVLYTGPENGLLVERDSLGRTWSGTFMRRYTKAIAFARSNPNLKVVSSRVLLPASDHELKQSAFYQQVMIPQGWRHAVALVFRLRPSLAPALTLRAGRTANEPDFSDDELARLEEIHPFLDPIVRHFFEVSSSKSLSDGIVTALRQQRRGFVVLDAECRIVHANAEGHRACAQWEGANRRSAKTTRLFTAPRAIEDSCRELSKALESRLRQNPDSAARMTLQLTAPAGSVASITAVCHSAHLSTAIFVIEFDRDRVRPRRSKRSQRVAGLTASEHDVAALVADGLSNSEAAERLGKSIHAVKFLLHQIYRKLGVVSRTQLALSLRRARPS